MEFGPHQKVSATGRLRKTWSRRFLSARRRTWSVRNSAWPMLRPRSRPHPRSKVQAPRAGNRDPAAALHRALRTVYAWVQNRTADQSRRHSPSAVSSPVLYGGRSERLSGSHLQRSTYDCGPSGATPRRVLPHGTRYGTRRVPPTVLCHSRRPGHLARRSPSRMSPSESAKPRSPSSTSAAKAQAALSAW